MFDIHKVKPIHGWREFIGEVGIIVLGVLIALGAESLIEKWHWHEQTALIRESIKEDIFNDAIYSWERLAVSPCLHRRTLQVLKNLKTNSRNWVGDPMSLGNNPNKSYFLQVYAAPYRPSRSDSWKSALAGGAFTHFAPEEQAKYASIFNEMQVSDNLQASEKLAATRLAPLAFDVRLDERAKWEAIAALAEIESVSSTVDSISRDNLSTIRTMHLGFDRARVERKRIDLLEGQRRYRGSCVQALPLSLN